MFKRVFEPITIGKLVIPNRIARTGHATYLSTTPFIGGDDFTAYHLERAKDGVGLSMLEASEVHPTTYHGTSLADDSIIPNYHALMKAVRPYGMRVFQQLWHGGHVWPSLIGPPWGVSSMPGPWGFVPVPMDKAQIEEIIAAYVAAARRCAEGGIDGIEFHAGHGYLPTQFLSPVINTREDEYGGSPENRFRFLKEVLEGVRAAVGPDMVVGARVSAGTLPGVLDADVVADAVQRMQDLGLIDYINVSYGDYFLVDSMIAGMHAPMGVNLPKAAPITAVAKVPRVVGGRFRTLAEAEQVLADGDADIVGMVRAFIADPRLITKTKAGNADQVRPCIACNQGCVGGGFRVHRIGCTVNAAVGAESTLSEDLIARGESPKKVLVVGGGPAGMEAARVAALAGHQVILAEASPNLGGAVNVARRAPRLHTLGDITYWLEQEVYRLGVDVRLNAYMEADEVRAIGADQVIIATGSYPRMDGVQVADPTDVPPGVHLPHVLSSIDLLTQPDRDLGTTAVVLDNVGHYEGIAAAEYLIEKGLSVTFVTHDYAFAPQMRGALRDDPALKRLNEGDFEVVIRHHLAEIRRGECVIRPVHNKRLKTIPADTVVLVTPNAAVRDLYAALKPEMPDIQIVGDAMAPRELQIAIAEGHRAARAIA